MSTLDEMCKLHWDACFQEPWESLDFHGQEIQREAMREVLRKHVEPMIAEAWMQGTGWNGEIKRALIGSHAEPYAARIIAELTATKEAP